MEKAAELDFDAFAAGSYARYLRIAFLLTGDHHHAEDLVQVALAKASLAWHRVRSAEDPDTYVRRVMTNAHISSRRRRWWRELPTAVLRDPAGADPHRAVDDRDQLRRALAQLSPRQRAAVVLRYYADLSEADTAATLGCSVGTVKTLAFRGLQRLHALLTASDPGEAAGDAEPSRPDVTALTWRVRA